MKNINHPYGNTKSFTLKFIKKIIQNIIRFFVNVICKLDEMDEIIISPATHAPWKKDSELASICDSVRFVGRKSGKELASLVANSLAMVYVSYFEGFGIPVLEGMKCGIPVVTSDVTSMPEVAGDAAIYVDPFSEDSIKEGLLKATSKDNFKIYREKSLVQAKRFDWNKSAEKVWSVINQEIQKI